MILRYKRNLLSILDIYVSGDFRYSFSRHHAPRVIRKNRFGGHLDTFGSRDSKSSIVSLIDISPERTCAKYKGIAPGRQLRSIFSSSSAVVYFFTCTPPSSRRLGSRWKSDP